MCCSICGKDVFVLSPYPRRIRDVKGLTTVINLFLNHDSDVVNFVRKEKWYIIQRPRTWALHVRLDCSRVWPLHGDEISPQHALIRSSRYMALITDTLNMQPVLQ